MRISRVSFPTVCLLFCYHDWTRDVSFFLSFFLSVLEISLWSDVSLLNFPCTKLRKLLSTLELFDGFQATVAPHVCNCILRLSNTMMDSICSASTMKLMKFCSPCTMRACTIWWWSIYPSSHSSRTLWRNSKLFVRFHSTKQSISIKDEGEQGRTPLQVAPLFFVARMWKFTKKKRRLIGLHLLCCIRTALVFSQTVWRDHGHVWIESVT